MHIAGADRKPTGDKGASISAELPIAGDCEFTIKSNLSSFIKCDRFHLDKPVFKGGKHWNMEMTVGGEVSIERVRELGRSQPFPIGVVIAVEPTGRIIAAATDPEDVLVLSVPWYKRGIIELKFPLTGLAEALEGSGIVEVPESGDQGEDSYCRPEDVLGPGDSCEIHRRDIDF